jgi:hypothetical protein
MKRVYAGMLRDTFDKAASERGFRTSTSRYFMSLHPVGSHGEWTGWKFRVSCSEAHVARAWDIVVDTMMTNSAFVTAAKVVTPFGAKTFSDSEHGQAGKMVTIYMHDGMPPEAVMNMMRVIDARLNAAKILTGCPVKGDRAVPGSRYLSYRNDRSDDGEYIPAKANAGLSPEQRYNPFGYPDPYAGFTIGSVRPPNPDARP